MKKRRTLIFVIVGVLACAGVVFVAPRLLPASTGTTANVQMGRATRATLLLTVESSGSSSPLTGVNVGFGTAGTVSKVNVSVGDAVKAGDVLAQLDTSDLELQIAQQTQSFLSQQAAYSMTIQPDPNAVKSAQLALNNASAAYKLAQQKYTVNSTDQVSLSCNNLDSARQAYDDAVTAYNNYLTDWRVIVYGTYEVSPQRAQLDRATASYDQALTNCNLAKSNINDSGLKSAWSQVQQARHSLDELIGPSERTLATAKAQLDQAQLSLDQARRQLDKAQIVAPVDGVVTAVNVVAGGPGSAATTIGLADVRQYHVNVLVDETEISQIKVGQKAEVTFDALPDLTVTGKVTRINPAGTVSQGVVNYGVQVDLDPAKAALRIDMTANVRIILDTHADVLAVPGGAIRSDPATNGYYVNVVNDSGEAQRVDVVTGYTDGDLTEISGDVQPGAQVYLSEPPAQQQGGFNMFAIRAGGR
ncbi:MAG: efflux RND transporter periplasmic adaptor subunit [Chloroflexi bacterium]|nr:efflux RND transporter periplasmic adaptor subunit [Chloroflexota bacterium]